MARTSQITLAQRPIAAFLGETEKAVFREEELWSLLDDHRTEWGLPATTTPQRIAQKLVDNGFLRIHSFIYSTGGKELLYLYSDPTIYEIAFALRPKSYISHYPAVYLHDLTTQVPKTIYTTREQSAKPHRDTHLAQEAIDQAFSTPQRRSQLSTNYFDYTILLLNGMHSNRSGVLLNSRYKNAFSYTSLERTLIDITVRPNYAGGAFAVLEAFRRAVNQGHISGNKFQAVYSNIPFIYPYHQALGFYLERAGYAGKLLDGFRQMPRLHTFYLDYAMEAKTLDKYWKIWYPTGM